MSRLDVRCEVSLPVTVSFQNNSGITTQAKSKFSNLSLGGGLILGKHLYPPKNILNLRYKIPADGEVKVHGEIIRYENAGMVTKFIDINKKDKIKLWEYLGEHIHYISSCPYCRNKNITGDRECKKCGLNLNFNSPDYVINHERESFIKKLAMKSDFFSLDDISRILHFVDVEVLGIEKRFVKQLSGSIPMKETMRLIEKQKLTEALKKYNNNISKVAKALEVSRPTVYKMMKKYGIYN